MNNFKLYINELSVKDIKITAAVMNKFYDAQYAAEDGEIDVIKYKNNNIYDYDNYIFIFEGDDLLAFLWYELDGDDLIIKLTQAIKFKSFYKFIFEFIFKEKKVQQILSDSQISNGALKSYAKLTKLYDIKIYDYDEDEYRDFNRDNFYGDSVVSIKEK
jgi:hypothetical protein